MSFDELERLVLRLDRSALASLAEKLLQSLDDLRQGENEEWWLAEIKQQIARGDVILKDGDTVVKELEAEPQ